MEKEQILSTLNEKLGQTSLSQRTISDYINANLPAEGAEPDDAYWDKHTKILKSLGGNFSADVARQVEDFKKNYKPSEQPHQPTEDPQPNKEVEDLKAELAKITQRLDEEKNQQTQQQLLEKVKTEMTKQGADDKYVLDKTLQGITLDEKKSVEDIVKELMPSYNTELTACRGKGVAPRNGGQGGGKGKNQASEYFARKQKREGWGGQSKK